MKPASQAVIDYLQQVRAGNRQLTYADTYTFIFSDGSKAFYTNAQRSFAGISPFQVISSFFVSNEVMISGLRFKLGVGVEVDEQEVTVAYTPDAAIQGQGWRAAVTTGQLDGARIQRDRFFFQAWGQPTIGSVPMFYGRVSSISDIGRTSSKIKVKSDLVVMNQTMPHNLQQPSCIHTLFDSGCKLSKADHAVSDVIAGSPTPTRSFIPFAASTALFALGTIAVEVAPSLIQTRTIKKADTSGVWLSYPLDYTPAAGMSINAWEGCDKTYARCGVLGNQINYKGFPFVPPPETAL